LWSKDAYLNKYNPCKMFRKKTESWLVTGWETAATELVGIYLASGQRAFAEHQYFKFSQRMGYCRYRGIRSDFHSFEKLFSITITGICAVNNDVLTYS
jgi:hypothetical protein